MGKVYRNVRREDGIEGISLVLIEILVGFLHSSVSKESACNAGDPGSIPRSGRSPGERNVTHSSILAWRIPWTDEPGKL